MEELFEGGIDYIRIGFILLIFFGPLIFNLIRKKYFGEQSDSETSGTNPGSYQRMLEHTVQRVSRNDIRITLSNNGVDPLLRVNLKLPKNSNWRVSNPLLPIQTLNAEDSVQIQLITMNPPRGSTRSRLIWEVPLNQEVDVENDSGFNSNEPLTQTFSESIILK